MEWQAEVLNRFPNAFVERSEAGVYMVTAYKPGSTSYHGPSAQTKEQAWELTALELREPGQG